MVKKTSRKPRPKTQVAVSEGIDLDPSGKLGEAASVFMASCGSSKAVVTKKKSNGAGPETKKPAKPQAAKREYRRFSFPVGMVIQKTFKGQNHEVTVVEGGFEYQDMVFKSITAVAKRITGYSVSGPVFFGLVEDDVVRDEG